MIEIKFYANNSIDLSKLMYVVIMAEYNGKWIMVRHRERNTWEIPGGHIEKDESLDQSASRELYEEAGAKTFQLTSISTYSVVRSEGLETFGQLYYAKIHELGPLPESEIAEIKLVDDISGDLTYPDIQPVLGKKVLEYLKSNNLSSYAISN